MSRKFGIESIHIVKAEVSDTLITAHLSDERIISLPLKRIPKLELGMQANQRDLVHNFKISSSGYGIHWPDLDEDISIKAFL